MRMICPVFPPAQPVCHDENGVEVASSGGIGRGPRPGRVAIVAVLMVLVVLGAPLLLQAETTHRVYLKGTESELDVYCPPRGMGEKPSPLGEDFSRLAVL
jgi:hypothetical protein